MKLIKADSVKLWHAVHCSRFALASRVSCQNKDLADWLFRV